MKGLNWWLGSLLVGALLLSACSDRPPPTPPPDLVDATARAVILTARAQSDTALSRSLRTDTSAASTDDLRPTLEYWSSDPKRFLILADCVSVRIETLALSPTAD